MAESQAHEIINNAKIKANEIKSQSNKAADMQIGQHKRYLEDKLKQTQSKFDVSSMNEQSQKETKVEIEKIYSQYKENKQHAVDFLMNQVTSFDIQINPNLKVSLEEDGNYDQI